MIDANSKYLLTVLLTLLVITSCEVINPDESIPSFLSIPAIALQSDYAFSGSDSEKISEAWVFANDDLIGSFELPARVPIIGSGETSIGIFPGIKKNGIADTRDIYPFYGSYSQEVVLQEGETIEINPTVTYREDVLFPGNFDFENSTGFENKDDGNLSDLSFTSNESEVFEGNTSMKVRTNSSNETFTIGTSSTYVINPTDVIETYIEMDYKNEGSFNVFVTIFNTGNEGSFDLITISPKEDWNKIYIEIGQVLRSFNATAFEVGFRTTALPEDQTTGTYLFDNVKIVLTSL